MLIHGAEYYPFGRGNLGRTPTLKQTDLFVAHRFSFGGRYGVEVNANILNLLDSDTATAVYQLAGNTDVTDAQFFAGFNPNTTLVTPDPLYNQVSQYQAPREVRLGLRFTF
jgi:hypothetical protein